LRKLDFNDVPLLVEEKEHLLSLKNRFNLEVYLVKDICILSEEFKGRNYVGIKIKEEHIEEFIVYSKQIVDFPFDFNVFKFLKKLRMNGLEFTRNFNPGVFSAIQELEYLDLAYCYFRKNFHLNR